MNEKIDNLDAWLHWNMAFVGGFFGAYALMNRMETFGSSETSNMIYIITALLGHNIPTVLIRLVALLLYIAGIELTVCLTHFAPKVNLRFVAVGIDMAAMLLLAQLPADMNFIVGLYPIFFATAVQWCVFSGAKGYNCASIFSTNNLKQASLGLGHYLLEKETAQLEKFKFYGMTLLFYHLGVAYVWLSCHYWGIKGAYTGMVPLAIAWIGVTYRGRLAADEKNSCECVPDGQKLQV